MDKASILVFGTGELQQSIIVKAKAEGLYVIGIDPCPDAVCKDAADAFEVVRADDYEGTLGIVKKYNVSAVITAATDKPLVMMSRIAEACGLNFFSVDTATVSTDKFLMKQRFLNAGIKCAAGHLVANADELEAISYPIVMKPRDNSGSRGVIFCDSYEIALKEFQQVCQYTHKQTILAEEFIGGKEYSVEALHFNGKTEVLQYTEKLVTPLPYNVELGHVQPAELNSEEKAAIDGIITSIAACMNYENCASHTEIKINDKGIFVIETSPRLGGDYITSDLVYLSTGIDIERQLIKIAIGKEPDLFSGRRFAAAGVRYLSLKNGIVQDINPDIYDIAKMEGLVKLSLKLCKGQKTGEIHNSLDRYGGFIVQAENRNKLEVLLDKYEKLISSNIIIN